MRDFGNHPPAGSAPETAEDQSPSPRQGRARRPRNLALGVLCTLLAVGGSGAIGYALLTDPTPPPQPTAAQAGTLHPKSSGHDRVSAMPSAMPASQPTRLRIPSIDVDAAVDTLGVNTDGTVEVPSDPDNAGWYDGSVTPGQLGAAVLLGHVDFVTTGPAVFYRLGELQPGATILVARKDGTSAQFTVDAVREFPKDNFPTDQVYGPVDGSAQLRLITCGSWDSDQHKYTGNTVVFATLTPPPATSPAKPAPHAATVPATPQASASADPSSPASSSDSVSDSDSASASSSASASASGSDSESPGNSESPSATVSASATESPSS